MDTATRSPQLIYYRAIELYKYIRALFDGCRILGSSSGRSLRVRYYPQRRFFISDVRARYAFPPTALPITKEGFS